MQKQQVQKTQQKAKDQQTGVMSFDSFFDEAGTFNNANDGPEDDAPNRDDDFEFSDEEEESGASTHEPAVHDLLDSHMHP